MAEKKCITATASTHLEKDQSFGIIPLRKQKNNWDVFIIKHKAGHFGFPKGHLINEHERPKEAAERELQEETGLFVKSYYALEPIQVNYECVSHGKHVNKYVTFFVAEVDGDICLSPEEIEAGLWLSLDKAYQQFQFDNMKKIIERLQEIRMYER